MCGAGGGAVYPRVPITQHVTGVGGDHTDRHLYLSALVWATDHKARVPGLPPNRLSNQPSIHGDESSIWPSLVLVTQPVRTWPPAVVIGPYSCSSRVKSDPTSGLCNTARSFRINQLESRARGGQMSLARIRVRETVIDFFCFSPPSPFEFCFCASGCSKLATGN